MPGSVPCGPAVAVAAALALLSTAAAQTVATGQDWIDARAAGNLVCNTDASAYPLELAFSAAEPASADYNAALCPPTGTPAVEEVLARTVTFEDACTEHSFGYLNTVTDGTADGLLCQHVYIVDTESYTCSPTPLFESALIEMKRCSDVECVDAECAACATAGTCMVQSVDACFTDLHVLTTTCVPVRPPASLDYPPKR